MEKTETCRRRCDHEFPESPQHEELTKPLTSRSTCTSTTPADSFSSRPALIKRSLRRGLKRSVLAKIAAGSTILFVGSKIHTFLTRVPLPEPCRHVLNSNARLRALPSSQSKYATPGYYHNVPNSLELFSENRVICPKQTADTLRNGGIASASPRQWAEYRQAVQEAGQGWKGVGSGRGLIVFKRGGSGSTWFDSLLGNHPSVDFRHEAHHSVFAPFHGPEKATQRMRNFLKGGKKCRSEQGYCGFSISPTKHAKDVDWSELIRVTGASIVVFVRTNVIKRLLGLERKSLVHALPKRCRRGSSYKPEMKDDPACAMNTSVELGFGRIMDGTDEANFLQAWDLIETALSTGGPFQILSYEGMQQNLTSTFETLGSFSGWPLSSFDWASHVRHAKVTSEDLRESVSNYDEVEQWLQNKPCFLDMLHSENKQIFPLCHAPRNFTVTFDNDADVDDVEEEEGENGSEDGDAHRRSSAKA